MEMGLSGDEFWRLTPRKFHLLSEQYANKVKRQLDAFRFLATVTARSMGADVNYMEDADGVPEPPGPGVFEAWLTARANRDAATNNNQDGGTAGASGSNEAPGGVGISPGA